MLREPLRPATESPLRSPLQARVGGSPSLDAQIAAIYAAGRLGPWFDPSDLATMYTTRAGMTNVGTPGDGTAHFVGRLEDKSQGRVLGAELVTNGGFSSGLTGWTASGAWAEVGGQAVKTGGSVATMSQGILAANKSYQISITVASLVGTLIVYCGSTVTRNITASGTYTFVLNQGGDNTFYLQCGGTSTATIDNISVRELPGYHALAANDTTARPQLSARVNLITYSDDLSNAVWSAILGATKDTATTLTIGTFANSSVRQIRSIPGGTASQSFTAKVILSVSSGTALFRIQNTHGGVVDNFSSNFTATTTPTLFEFTVSNSASAGDGNQTIGIVNASDASSNGRQFIFGGADLRPTNIHAAGSIPPYQRVLDPETYDSVGFPYRLIPNGTGQALQTSTITPGADSVTVGVGVRKLSDAATAIVLETSPDALSTAGAIAIFAPSSNGSNSYRFVSNGTSSVTVGTGVFAAAPDTAIIVSQSVINAPSASIRRNQALVAGSTVTQGTGNYTAQPLNLFARGIGGTPTLWFGGQFFCDVVMFGPQLSAGELATVEAWINSKTKAY